MRPPLLAALFVLSSLLPAAQAAAPADCEVAWAPDDVLAHNLPAKRSAAGKARLFQARNWIRRISPRRPMALLDMDSRTGERALMLARQLGPRTDITALVDSSAAASLLERRAHDKGLQNIRAYGEASALGEILGREPAFDLVILDDSFRSLCNAAKKLKQVGRGMKEDGRVFVIGPKTYNFRFFSEDFKDPFGLLAFVAAQPDDSALAHHLFKALPILRTHVRRDIPAAMLTRELLFGLNKIISRRRFTMRFLSGPEAGDRPSLSDEEGAHFDWLLLQAEALGMWISPSAPTTAEEPEWWTRYGVEEWAVLRRINKLLLIGLLRPYLSPECYVSADPAAREYDREPRISGVFASAGFHLESSHDLRPFERIWIFRKGTGGTR